MGGRYPVAFWAMVVGVAALVGSCLGLLGREWAEEFDRPPSTIVITRAPAPPSASPPPAPSPATFSTPFATSTLEPR
jgi:hypothetical protein